MGSRNTSFHLSYLPVLWSLHSGEQERYTHLNAELQRIARRDKETFLRDQCKEIEENNRTGKTRDLFKKTRDTNGEGNGTPLQYTCLENPMDGGAWWAAVHGVAKSQTRLSDFTFTFHFHALEKEMATHSSVLAWRIPGTGGAWWAAVCGVAQSWTRLKQLSSSSTSKLEK